MADVLNLALKKEIFEGLKNGVSNEIPIEKTNWWKKRLMDVDTGRFKPFKQVIATCGSADKFLYDIEKIELVGDTFIITVVNNNKPEQETNFTQQDAPLGENNEGEPVYPNQLNPEQLEPVTINPVTVNVDGSVTMKKDYVPPTVTVEEKQDLVDDIEEEKPEQEVKEEPKKKDLKQVVMDFIDGFCNNNNVFVVNMPRVTIRNNGQVFGCNKKLFADKDSDVMFEFKKSEFVKHPQDMDSRFAMTIVNYFANLSNNNYVFINRKATGFTTDEYGNITLTVYAVAKRKYLFKR